MDIYSIPVWMRDERNSYNIYVSQQILYMEFSGIPETFVS